MKFRYELMVKKISWPIHYQHQLFLIGSCFTENMGEKLSNRKFSVLQNPHGILFNPVSVVEAIKDYTTNRQYSVNDLFHYNEAWHSWHHHSRFSGITEVEAIHQINTSITEAHQYLKYTDYLFVTLGSAWVYQLTTNAPGNMAGMVVANNHKGPAAWFERKLLTPENVSGIIRDMYRDLITYTPGLKIIFTISPVRHLREGAVENNRSKAVLMQAVHDLVDTASNCYYFPAYELVIDDLRDYRFYAEDLVHPNYQATQYVWEKFVTACTSPETQKMMERLDEIRLAFTHRPFNSASAQHQRFLQSYFEKTRQLQQQHPYLNLKDELTYFNSKGNTMNDDND